MNLDRFQAILMERFNIYKNRYKNPKVVMFKFIYYILSNLSKLGVKAKPSDTWYKVGDTFDENDKLSCVEKEGWNIPNVILKSNEHLYFSIDRALKIKPDLKGVWLVFFMGIGDYFNASAFVEQLRKTYPELEFNAFVSKNVDINNSPLVAEILKTNPNISKVEFFDGHRNEINYRNYDYSDCYNRVSEDYIIVPMIYDYAPNIVSRHKTLCETFSLKEPSIMPLPKIYPYPVSDNLRSFYDKVNNAANGANGVVFVQMSSRSIFWSYPYTKDIVENLLKDNYVVISVENCGIEHSNYFEIDTKKFNINETIELLKMLKHTAKLCCMTLNSCFWTISAGLGIPNLGLQYRDNASMVSEYFPNIYCISGKFVDGISASMQFVADKTNYDIEHWRGLDLYLYKPEFVYACFKYMKKRLDDEK